MDQIRDLRTLHLGSLIQVKGVITRRTSVFPQLQMLRFVCKVCNNATTPIPQNTSTEVKPPACTYCGKKSISQSSLSDSPSSYAIGCSSDCVS